MTEEQIRGLASFENNLAFSDLEKDIIRFTEQWTHIGKVAEDVMERLTRKLANEHLVILAATVALANFTCRFNNVFGVELP